MRRPANLASSLSGLCIWSVEGRRRTREGSPSTTSWKPLCVKCANSSFFSCTSSGQKNTFQVPKNLESLWCGMTKSFPSSVQKTVSTQYLFASLLDEVWSTFAAFRNVNMGVWVCGGQLYILRCRQSEKNFALGARKCSALRVLNPNFATGQDSAGTPVRAVVLLDRKHHHCFSGLTILPFASVGSVNMFLFRRVQSSAADLCLLPLCPPPPRL